MEIKQVSLSFIIQNNLISIIGILEFFLFQIAHNLLVIVNYF